MPRAMPKKMDMPAMPMKPPAKKAPKKGSKKAMPMGLKGAMPFAKKTK